MDFYPHGSGRAHRGGLFESVKALASTLVEIGRTRLELLSLDLEEERVRLVSMMVWGIAGLFFAGLGILLIVLFVVVAFWDTHRLLALASATLVVLAGAAVCWKVVLDKARAKPRLFAGSLAELSRDQEHLARRS